MNSLEDGITAVLKENEARPRLLFYLLNIGLTDKLMSVSLLQIKEVEQKKRTVVHIENYARP